jgi:uncharacterized membrane protein YkoI
MERTGSWFRALTAALALGLAAPAVIAHSHDHDRQIAEQLLQSGEILPLQEVLSRVAKVYPGQVLKVEFEEESDLCQEGHDCPDRWIYELRILQAEGRLVKIKADARTGEILWVGSRARNPEKKP